MFRLAWTIMTRTGRGFRRALAAPLWVLMMLPSVSIPILDRAQVGQTLAVERPASGPASHPRGHDHRLCTQVRANPPVPTVATAHRQADEVIRVPVVVSRRIPFLRALRSTCRSRAPPLV
jgi:hypothetical protein